MPVWASAVAEQVARLRVEFPHLRHLNPRGPVEQQAVQAQADQPTENRCPYIVGEEVGALQHAAH